VLDGWVDNEGALYPAAYDAAGCPGLLPLPAGQEYTWQVRAYVDGTPAGGWVAGEPFGVEYGLPGQAQLLGSDDDDPADELFDFQFDVVDAARYRIVITNTSGFRYDQEVTFPRLDDGKQVLFVGPFEHANVFLPDAGPFTWWVQGWNPLGWGPASATATEPGPTAEDEDLTPSKPVPVAQPVGTPVTSYQMGGFEVNDAGRGEVTLQWSASHATSYQLKLKQLRGAILFNGYLTAANYETNGLYYPGSPVPGLKPGRYVWYVRAYNANAVTQPKWGPWSDPCYFEVLEPVDAGGPPGAVTVLTAPTYAGGVITLSLQADNAVSFTVKVMDPDARPRVWRTVTGLPATPGVGQTIPFAPAPARMLLYQAWAVNADGSAGPMTPILVIVTAPVP